MIDIKDKNIGKDLTASELEELYPNKWVGISNPSTLCEEPAHGVLQAIFESKEDGFKAMPQLASKGIKIMLYYTTPDYENNGLWQM